MAQPDTEEPLSERLGRTVKDHDRRRLQTRFSGVGVTTIAAAQERRPIRIVGEVRSQHRSAPDHRLFLRVEIDDGTATAIMMFTGRNRVRGLETGRAVVAEGVGGRERGRLVIWNPAYTLLGEALPD